MEVRFSQIAWSLVGSYLQLQPVIKSNGVWRRVLYQTLDRFLCLPDKNKCSRRVWYRSAIKSNLLTRSTWSNLWCFQGTQCLPKSQFVYLVGFVELVAVRSLFSFYTWLEKILCKTRRLDCTQLVRQRATDVLWCWFKNQTVRAALKLKYINENWIFSETSFYIKMYYFNSDVVSFAALS